MPPLLVFHTRPGCTSVKLADGNASFCASLTERYWTAWAGALNEITAAAGAVHRDSPVIGRVPVVVAPPAHRCVRRSEEEAGAAENGIDCAPAGSRLITFW